MKRTVWNTVGGGQLNEKILSDMEALAKMLVELNEHRESYRDLIRVVDDERVNKWRQGQLEKALTKDVALLREYHQMYLERQNMQIGDWVLTKAGVYMQVTVTRYGNEFQAVDSNGSHYCYLGKYTDYSGVCGNAYKKENFVLTDELKDGHCWFFHEGYAGGGRGVEAIMPFKVWKEI